ncbi:MAG: hypothetical protein ACYSTZ_08460, partial [Planctomycetota bacterium]|jgi:hypothetical protein
MPFADAAKALEGITGVFVQSSFQIVEKSETTVELTGPGMISSRQDPLVGISKIRISRTSGSLSVEAQFDSIRRLIKYIAVFIVCMGVFFVILFGILFTSQGQPMGIIVLISLAPFAPWPVLLPLIMRWLKSRTSRALDVLLSNTAYLARQESST